ncbi:MAG: TetR/AcrR family transcriptional regulator [Thermoleophilia bacterium]|nr:TetR/AcrR family transcriptional regulator [Thermoleophilia bacterium]
MSATASPRQEELLDGLVELFLAEGFQRFTLADLANHLHCSKTSLYGLGHSKESVMLNVLARFFRRATEEVEERAGAESEPSARIVAYLRAVADELRPASAQFITDVAAHPAARAVYERNTRIAAERVSAMIAEGVRVGAFRKVHAVFAADLIAATMTRIQSGEVNRHTGLSDAVAYDDLADLVLNGIAN